MTAHHVTRVERASPRRALLVAAGLMVALVAAACGGGRGETTAPPPVPTDLAPDQMMAGQLNVRENRATSTREVLAANEDSALVGDTRVWEIRRADRLVATLQISAVLPKVDLADQDVRERFAAQVMLGATSRLRVGDVEVFTTSADDKTVYLWFGARLFEVLQTKDRELVPEELLAELIRFQHNKDGWDPIVELVGD